MKELIIATVLGAVAFLATASNKPEQETQTYEVTNDSVGVLANHDCSCNPCLCDPCLCDDKKEVVKDDAVVEVFQSQPEVLVKQVVESQFDDSLLKSDLDSLQGQVFAMQSEMNLLSKRVTTVEVKPFMTEKMVRDIVKDEVQVQLKLMNTVTGKEVVKSVPVRNTGSEIVLAPGEILMSIDGVPVNQSPMTSFQRNQRVNVYQTPSYQMNVPAYSNSRPVRAALFPRMNSFRSNSQVCGPGGCN